MSGTGFRLDRETILHLIEGIEVATAAHQVWLKRLHQGLLFDSEPLESFEHHDSHLRTPLGQWHEGNAQTYLAELLDYAEIGHINREMHEVVHRICQDRRTFGRSSEEDYDHCLTLSLHLDAALRSLQMEVLGELLATDALTGCLGRRGMLDRLNGELSRVVRHGKRGCLCLLDIDHFKKVNDTRGHAAGDAALIQVTRYVMDNLRGYDHFYRFGGEEFLICLPDTPLSQAANIVERLRAGIEALSIVPAEGERFSVTASFGLVELLPSRTVEASIEAADQALYRAKRGGRNWVEIEGMSTGGERSAVAAIRPILANANFEVLIKTPA